MTDDPAVIAKQISDAGNLAANGKFSFWICPCCNTVSQNLPFIRHVFCCNRSRPCRRATAENIRAHLKAQP